MRWIVLLAMLVLTAVSPVSAQTTVAQTTGASATGAQAGTSGPIYRLNPGDIVRISVWREEELLREARIQPDGSVSYPLVGSVEAAGRSADAVAEEIKERLAQFIPDAVVTVELLEAQGYRIYVIGEVSRPGEYQLAQPITVMQALSIAGGLTPFAGTSEIRILRTRGDPQMNLAFDYDAVADDGEMNKNVFLEAGDTVIVPSSFF